MVLKVSTILVPTKGIVLNKIQGNSPLPHPPTRLNDMKANKSANFNTIPQSVHLYIDMVLLAVLQ